jgi:hypothetical protein
MFEEKYQLYLTKEDGVKSGRFMDRYGAENLFCLEFDYKIRPVDVQAMLCGGIIICGKSLSSSLSRFCVRIQKIEMIKAIEYGDDGKRVLPATLPSGNDRL